MSPTGTDRATLLAPVNARIAVSSSRSIDYPLTASLHIAVEQDVVSGGHRRSTWEKTGQSVPGHPRWRRALTCGNVELSPAQRILVTQTAPPVGADIPPVTRT